MRNSSLEIKNSEERLIYVYDHLQNETELIVSVKDTVLDLKHKIEDKYHLPRDTLLKNNIRRKNLKNRTQVDLLANDTTLKQNHIYNETGIYFSVLENPGGIKISQDERIQKKILIII